MIRHSILSIAVFCGSVLTAAGQGVPSVMHIQRESASDLEVSGMLRGVPAGESRYVSRKFLIELPQVAAEVQQSEMAYGPKVAMQGVSLETLGKQLGLEEGATAAAVICKDGYTATFSPEYIRTHKPVVLLTVEGMAPHDWAVKRNRFDPGPYFVGYPGFVPAFHVLSHTDRPAEPDGIEKIIFDREERFYGAIRPKRIAGNDDASMMDGYKIAQQNCYRCHNAGKSGGTKAGVSWHAIGAIAKERPKFFAAWVHDPQSIKPQSAMPPNKNYSKETMAALQRYFAPFAEEGE